MKVELNLPLPEKGDNTEQILVEQFSHLVSVCKSVLATYKSQGLEVPVVSIKIPSKFKITKEPSEAKRFVEELWNYHVRRVPTANGAVQRKVLYWMYESGHTDVPEMIRMYEERLKSYPDTSWTTVKWALGKGAAIVAADDPFEFKRTELTEEAQEALKERIIAAENHVD